MLFQGSAKSGCLHVYPSGIEWCCSNLNKKVKLPEFQMSFSHFRRHLWFIAENEIKVCEQIMMIIWPGVAHFRAQSCQSFLCFFEGHYYYFEKCVPVFSKFAHRSTTYVPILSTHINRLLFNVSVTVRKPVHQNISIELLGYNHKLYYFWLHTPSHASTHTCSWKTHSASLLDW